MECVIYWFWCVVLLFGVSILLGVYFDVKEWIERMEWYSDGVKWNVIYYVDIGECIFVIDWRSGIDGW